MPRALAPQTQFRYGSDNRNPRAFERAAGADALKYGASLARKKHTARGLFRNFKQKGFM
jgi:hypothetical protein